MHKIYIDEGSFNLIYQIPQIIYSSVISNIIDIIIKYLSLTEKEVIKIKLVKKHKSIDLKFNKLFKILKIKFIYFLLSLFYFWRLLDIIIFVFVEYILILKFI